MDKQKPLTLEELRQMNGKQVFDKKTGRRYTVQLNIFGIGECLVYRGGYFLPLEIAEMMKLYAL